MLLSMSSLERRKLVFLIIVIFFLVSLSTVRRYDVDVSRAFSHRKHVPPLELSDAEISSWKTIVKLLDQHAPGCRPPKRTGFAEFVPFTDQTQAQRPNVLSMPEKDVEQMRKAHEGFVKAVNALPSLLSYTAGSEGIVTTAGGRYLPVVTISIRMIRRTGSRLPVEVFLTSADEYERAACEEILPALGARCVVLRSYYRHARPRAPITKYQLKVFAMLLSSFDRVLFLDADCFPVEDPARLLRAEPFASKGLVTWPDFWVSTAHPHYFRIAGYTHPPSTALRATSEAGELLVAKRRHAPTLALAAYYNYWGPDFYYPLLSQGSLGEGDKETFLSAALALNAPFYAVAAPVRAIGNLNRHVVFQGSAMVQYDPRDDARLVDAHGGPAAAGGAPAISQSRAEPPRTRPAFVHANVPKFNPGTLFAELLNPTVGPGGRLTRVWVEHGGIGLEVERRFWEEIAWAACELDGQFESWRETGSNCKLVQEYRKEVFGDATINATRTGMHWQG